MTYRIYFNRWRDAPLIWSVDEGTQATERNVREVRFDGVTGRTNTGPGDNYHSPTVWIEVEARLEISGEVAILRAPIARQQSRAA
jgi:hypothetical protein